MFSSILKIFFLIAAFCSALCFGALKAVFIGPVAALIVIFGDVGVILGLFPAHVAWTVYTLIKTNRLDVPLKVAFLFGLPGLCGIWLGLGITTSVLVGVGYGFFTPWISTFEAFRQECDQKKFIHCLVDGTWDTIKGSCTFVRDLTDLCYHSYPLYLKELREASDSVEPRTLRFTLVPACISVGLLGLIVEIPLYTAIAIVKSPYLLFMGWYRLLHDLVSREGPFLEAACIPIAGLTILFWPLIVFGSIVCAIFASFFVGLYGSVIVYQERSFRRGVAYVIAMVAEFDEYTNDWLYLREGSILPKPRYRRKKSSHSTEFSTGEVAKSGPLSEAPAMLLTNLGPSRSVRMVIQEVQMVQIWEHMMKSCVMRGKILVDANAITSADLIEWTKARGNTESTLVGLGLPSYAFFQNLLNSIKVGSAGMMIDDLEINHTNRPQNRLMEWFFQPVVILKDQIKNLKMEEGEIYFVEKAILYGVDAQDMEAWDNGSVVPQDPVRAAQIKGICRRLSGISRSITKFPTYRRRYGQVVKTLITYCLEKESLSRPNSVRTNSVRSNSVKSHSVRSVASIVEVV